MPPRVIFFDLDETLIVNGRRPETIIADLYRDLLGPTDSELFERFMAELLVNADRTWRELHDREQTGDEALTSSFAAAIDHAGGDAGLAINFFEGFLHRSAAATRLSSNAIETLERLRARDFALGIITNGIEKVQQAKVDLHGLSEFVDTVVISEQAGAHKPDEKVFSYALNRAGFSANEAWHVGDHPENDVGGAMNAGLTAVFYDPSGERAQDAFPETALRPDRVISDLFEMTEQHML